MSADITFADMKRMLVRGWGDLGGRTADRWLEFNAKHFGGKLAPLPIFFTPSAPYGKALAWTCCGGRDLTHIALCRPRKGVHLVADAGVLLHEMVHAYLNETSRSPMHADAPWREEIMRLHFELTGSRIFAGRTRVIKVREDGKRRSVRVMAIDTSNGAPPLDQKAIARWPGSVGLDLGPL